LAWTFFVVLLAGWSAGLVNAIVTGNFLGGRLHLLLLGAVVALFLDALKNGQRTQS